MIAGIAKRIIFEISFLIAFLVLMPWHIFYAFILLIIECFKVYPTEIYNLMVRIYYGEEN